jgi:hypothetical protein
MKLQARMVAILTSCLLFQGCMFFSLNEDVEALDDAINIVGMIKTDAKRKGPIL